MKKDRPGCFSLPRRSASYTMQSTWSIPLIRQSCTALFECDADIIAGMTERSKKKFRKKIKKRPPRSGFIFKVVELTGFEPVTPTMSTWYSNHLSYSSETNISIPKGKSLVNSFFIFSRGKGFGHKGR